MLKNTQDVLEHLEAQGYQAHATTEDTTLLVAVRPKLLVAIECLVFPRQAQALAAAIATDLAQLVPVGLKIIVYVTYTKPVTVGGITNLEA